MEELGVHSVASRRQPPPAEIDTVRYAGKIGRCHDGCTSMCQEHRQEVRKRLFMPKPLFGDNGSGMHTHQSLWKKGKPLFAGNEYAGLSKMPSITRRLA